MMTANRMNDRVTFSISWAARILGIVTPIMVADYLVKRAVFNWPQVGFPFSFYTFEIVEIVLFCILLILAWKRPIAGGIFYLVIWPFFFFLIALEHGMSPHGRGPSLLSTIPPVLAGGLFLLSGLLVKSRRKKDQSTIHTPAG